MPLVTFNYSYYNAVLSQTEDLSSTCTILRKEGSPSVLEAVNKHDNRIAVANAMIKVFIIT